MEIEKKGGLKQMKADKNHLRLFAFICGLNIAALCIE